MNVYMKPISINTSEFYYLEWPKWMPHIKEFGFNCMEIAICDVREPDNIKEFSKLISDNKVEVSAVHDWFHFFSTNDEKEIKEMQVRLIKDLEYTHFLGADKLIWYTGENEKYQGEAAVKELIDRLKPVLKRAEELKITLLLETEFSKNGIDPAASVELLKQIFTRAGSPYLACNFDAANLYVAGVEPFPYAYEELKPWIRYVHIKDIRELVPGVHSIEDRKGYIQEGQKDGTCCAIGEGAINYTGLFKALKEDKFDGYLSMELHMKDEYQDETLKSSIDFVRQYW
jgi:Sugar phosphate isomerases/epimerases